VDGSFKKRIEVVLANQRPPFDPPPFFFFFLFTSMWAMERKMERLVLPLVMRYGVARSGYSTHSSPCGSLTLVVRREPCRSNKAESGSHHPSFPPFSPPPSLFLGDMIKQPMLVGEDK